MDIDHKSSDVCMSHIRKGNGKVLPFREKFKICPLNKK